MLSVECRVWSVKYTVWSVNCAVSKAVKENEQRGKMEGNGGTLKRSFGCRVWSVERGVLCNLASFCI